MVYDTDISSYDQIKDYDLVILHDMGWHSGYPLETGAVEAVIKFRDSGKPVMILGDDVACQIKNTSRVAELIKVSECTSNGPSGVVVTPTGNELVNIWGSLQEYTYDKDIDTADVDTSLVTVWMTSSNGPVAYTYIQNGPVAVYRHNIRIANSQDISDSSIEIVFKNLVSWLVQYSSTSSTNVPSYPSLTAYNS